jgi:hypothetical protein
MVRVASAQNYRRLSRLGLNSNVKVNQSGTPLRIANPPRIVCGLVARRSMLVIYVGTERVCLRIRNTRCLRGGKRGVNARELARGDRAGEDQNDDAADHLTRIR